MGIIPEMASNNLLLYNDTYICCIQTFCLWRYKVVIIWTFKIGFDVLIPTHLQKGTKKANLLLAVTFLFILCDSKCMLSCKKHVLDWFKKRDLVTFLGKYCQFHLLLLKSTHSVLLEGIIHCGNILEYAVWFEDCIKSCPEGCGNSKEKFQTCNRGYERRKTSSKFS